MYLVLFSSAATVAVPVWALTARRQLRRSPERLLDRLQPATDIAVPMLKDGGDSTVRESFHLMNSARHLCRQSRTLLLLNAILPATGEIGRLASLSFFIHLCLIGCILEIPLHLWISDLPRFFPQLTATLYGNMCSTVYTILETDYPEILEKAQELL